jgi:hypothetical protein
VVEFAGSGKDGDAEADRYGAVEAGEVGRHPGRSRRKLGVVVAGGERGGNAGAELVGMRRPVIGRFLPYTFQKAPPLRIQQVPTVETPRQIGRALVNVEQ